MHARKVWSLQESTSMGPDDLRVAQGRKHPDRTSEGHEIPFTTGLSILSNFRSRRSVPVSIIGISAFSVKRQRQSGVPTRSTNVVELLAFPQTHMPCYTQQDDSVFSGDHTIPCETCKSRIHATNLQSVSPTA